MPYKVLVVEDSSFFRRRVTDILNSDKELEVVGVAVNGIEAVEKAKTLKPDVITMDIEMPKLNGIEAVKQIMKSAPTSIIMFSSLTHHGAKSTLDALDAGALDFLPKKFAEIAKNTEDAGSLLRQRVLQLARKNKGLGRYKLKPIVAKNEHTKRETIDVRPLLHASANNAITKSSNKGYNLLAIGTSTGGPIALQKVLTQLPENFPLPIVLVQHMPASFTKAFADRLNTLCKITVTEAVHGEALKPGHAYLAPGGKQMLIDGSQSSPKLKVIDDSSERIAFKPSVDITFGSAAKVFGGNVLGIILTGMGSDGRDGCRLLKTKGATIWSQDEESCVVYGMPQAVANAGISDAALPLYDIAPSILKELKLK
jgi:two-component system chemotaxis response regulator CheB